MEVGKLLGQVVGGKVNRLQQSQLIMEIEDFARHCRAEIGSVAC